MMRTPFQFQFDPNSLGSPHSGAMISDCKLYRYALWRSWDTLLPMANFILLNPSTADHEIDDPTIVRLCARARQAKYGALVVTNAYAYRATKPDDLKRFARSGGDPIGPLNEKVLITFASKSKAVVIGWGTHVNEIVADRQAMILALLRASGIDCYDLGTNSDGTPKHPLYIPYSKVSAAGL
jgi:hypothetical protein